LDSKINVIYSASFNIRLLKKFFHHEEHEAHEGKQIIENTS